MENHHFQWVNPLFQWPFSIATLNYQRVVPRLNRGLGGGLPLSVPFFLTFSETWGDPQNHPLVFESVPNFRKPRYMILKDISNILKPANPRQQSNRAFLTVPNLRGINLRGHWTQLWEGKKLEKAGTSFLFWGAKVVQFFGKALDQSHKPRSRHVPASQRPSGEIFAGYGHWIDHAIHVNYQLPINE